MKHVERLIRGQEEIIAELKRTRERLAEISNQTQDGGVIPFPALEVIEPGEPFSPVSGITMHRLPSDRPDLLLFYVRMEAGAYLRVHEHDCWERGTMLWGDTFVNDSRLHAFETFLFPPGDRHRIFTRPGCGLILMYGKEKPA